MFLLEIRLVDFLPKLDVSVECSPHEVGLADIGMSVANDPRLLLLLEFVDHSLAASVESFDVLVENWEVVLDYLGMLVLCIEDQSHDEVDAFTDTG